jgi:hypothetical protein
VVRAEMLYARDKVESCTGSCEERTRARKAEESPLVDTVARERLVTLHGVISQKSMDRILRFPLTYIRLSS